MQTFDCNLSLELLSKSEHLKTHAADIPVSLYEKLKLQQHRHKTQTQMQMQQPPQAQDENILAWQRQYRIAVLNRNCLSLSKLSAQKLHLENKPPYHAPSPEEWRQAKPALHEPWWKWILFYPRQLINIMVVSLCCLSLCLLNTCWASSTGSTAILPYESWLLMFQKSVTGPVAFSVSLIGIVGCGAALILGGVQINTFLRTIIFIVLVMTLLVGANNLMTNFFNGASIGQVSSALDTKAAGAQINETLLVTPQGLLADSAAATATTQVPNLTQVKANPLLLLKAVD